MEPAERFSAIFAYRRNKQLPAAQNERAPRAPNRPILHKMLCYAVTSSRVGGSEWVGGRELNDESILDGLFYPSPLAVGLSFPLSVENGLSQTLLVAAIFKAWKLPAGRGVETFVSDTHLGVSLGLVR